MTQSASEFADAADRRAAVTTFDRSVVVTAGAGTGKTTLLIERLVHLLLRNPEPLKITEIVALTFTNKAADELKLRLRQRLQTFLDSELDREPVSAFERESSTEIQEIIALYRLSKDELESRVRDALRNLERSDLGTIHSFAANLLRLYPLEAGLDPQFHEDDGSAFEQLFDEQWSLWLDQELSLGSARAAEWQIILSRCRLDHVKALAKSLATENVDLRQNSDDVTTIPAALRDWLSQLENRATILLERHPEDRLNEKLLRAAHAIISKFNQLGRKLERNSEISILFSEKSLSRMTKGWSPEDIKDAQTIVRAAKGLVGVDSELIGILWRLLVTYAADFRERFVREGHVSFEGLLVRARDLVRDHARVRADVKRRYRAILLDEFQDTDPIQYEILLYLAEQPGQTTTDWRRVKVVPGKIFVVGDPKQSIYAFRRADIEAYLEIVEKVIQAQDGIECRLTTNFRSNRTILDGVNWVFENLIQAQHGLQPHYIPLYPAPNRVSTSSPIPKLLVRKIISARDMDAESARRLEGESLARWLKDEVLNKATILNNSGDQARAQSKDVAILLRKLTDIHDYLLPLRREGIRYVVEGERNFYAANEIIDAVSLLRAVEDPYDRLALVGVLRSPVGGLTDQQIYDLHRQNLLNYHAAEKLLGKKFPPSLAELYDALARLHEETRALSIGAAVTQVFATLPVELLAACYFHGEQAVANLQKLTREAELLGREGMTTLKQAIRQLEKRVLEIKDEGESALAEEHLDAVRIMSIHKAKGLEFPIVILAGCHAGVEGGRAADAEALFDWSTGLTGVRIGQFSDLAGLYIAEKSRLRTAEEQKRLLYVAMTRAREHLVISCAPGSRRSTGSFLSMLDSTVDQRISAAQKSETLPVGKGTIEIEVVSASLTAPSTSQKPASTAADVNWQGFMECWRRRALNYEGTLSSAPFVTPSRLKYQEQALTEAGDRIDGEVYDQTPALVLGDLAHRFLQHWDFANDVNQFERALHDWLAHTPSTEAKSSLVQIESELQRIFAGFIRSSAYSEVAASRILGREVPLVMPWNGQIMEGIIDLIYEKNGLLYLADYKTAKIVKAEVSQGVERYRPQAEIYLKAVEQSLGRAPAAFKVIFLRLGKAVELVPQDRNRELWLF
ncbi:MAG TPA: UvrD-helicase domain-containing protein [Candidatus Binatia bacterium]|nr:UvrD-helicase domain-containing protein [Candidatus Binatia bacterium]